jgi:hypothetical protein
LGGIPERRRAVVDVLLNSITNVGWEFDCRKDSKELTHRLENFLRAIESFRLPFVF